MTTLLCNIKAHFQYPGKLDSLLRGKISRYSFARKILSMHFVWANDGANQLVPVVCLQKYSLCEPPLTLHKVGVSTAAATPVQWRLRSQPAPRAPCYCPTLCLTSGAAGCSRRCERTGGVTAQQVKWEFICRAEVEGKRCSSAICTCTHICVSALKAQFQGMCDLCCRTTGCSQPGRLSTPVQVTDLCAIALTDKPAA